jgi:hypothetical protein
MIATFALAMFKGIIQKTGKKFFPRTSHLHYVLFLMAQKYQCKWHLKFSKIPLLTQIKRTLTEIRTFSVIHVAQNPRFFSK